jgi:hypothetical protein
MKVKQILFLMLLSSCYLQGQNNTNADTCNQLSNIANYDAELPRYQTIDFSEGLDTYRIVPDTSKIVFSVYLQKKNGQNCWNTPSDTFQCLRMGLHLADWNDDGYMDLSNQRKWWNEVYLYNPQTKNFSNRSFLGCCHRQKLANNVQFDIMVEGKFPKASESRLFRFEDFKLKSYAILKVYYYYIDDQGLGIAKEIKLFTVTQDKETLINQWTINDFPLFVRNNGFYDYFLTDDFITDYWKTHWQEFITK